MNASEEIGREIRQSWDRNALAWAAAVRGSSIPSRVAGTDAAILQAVQEALRRVGPGVESVARRVLDVGCGEGWLSFALHQAGCEVVGFDGSSTLLAHAREGSLGHFLHLSYEELCSDPARIEGFFDAVCCNFSLFADIVPLLRVLGSKLVEDGLLLIQTLPVGAEPEAQQEGWRREDFRSMATALPAAMPYYFRTLAAWHQVLADAGLRVSAMRAPVHPETGKPLSLILMAHAATGG